MVRVLYFSNYVAFSKERPIIIPPQHTEHLYDIMGPGRWKCDPHTKKKHLGIKDIFLHLIACGKAWIRWIRSYDVLITGSCWTVLLLGGYSYLMKGKRKLIASSFNVPKRRNRLWRDITRLLIRKIDIIYVHSKYDIELINNLYGFPKSKMRFCPIVRRKLQKVELPDKNSFLDFKDYIISFGANGRDYKTFFEAVSRTDLSAVVVARQWNLKGLTVPDNVKVLYNIPLEQCDRLVDGSRFVVLALDGSEPSCGQIAIVTSLMFGKPVICTDWIGIKDYVIDGFNGILVKIRDANDLQIKMSKLFYEPELYNRLSAGARTWTEQNANPSVLQQEIDTLVTRLTNSKEKR
jgi:glycosyltransferase involved in cell wall biosynthesis